MKASGSARDIVTTLNGRRLEGAGDLARRTLEVRRAKCCDWRSTGTASHASWLRAEAELRSRKRPG